MSTDIARSVPANKIQNDTVAKTRCHDQTEQPPEPVADMLGATNKTSVELLPSTANDASGRLSLAVHRKRES